jgi:prepilin-type N-terminal cleavage/methylation domain-containing protein
MSRGRKSSPSEGGFTLVEMIAVLAIISILASAIAPNIASQLKRARSDAEDATLAGLSRMLTETVIRNHAIPGTGTWANELAVLSDLPPIRIGTNEDNFPRVFVVDPGWLPVGTLPAAGGWTQTHALSWGLAGAIPSRCRILLFSGSQQDLSAVCGGLTAVEFDQIWNTQGGPAACREGDNVRIGRANLTSLFHQVTISSSANGHFSFDTPSISPAPAPQLFGSGSRTIPVLNGTRISFRDGVAGVNVLAEIVAKGPLSATWDGTAWAVP